MIRIILLLLLAPFFGFGQVGTVAQDLQSVVERESETAAVRFDRSETLRKSLFRKQLRREARKADRETSSAIREVLRDADLFEIAYESVLMQYHSSDAKDGFVMGADGQIINAIKDFVKSLIDNREGLIELIKSLVELFSSQTTSIESARGPPLVLQDLKKTIHRQPVPCGAVR